MIENMPYSLHCSVCGRMTPSEELNEVADRRTQRPVALLCHDCFASFIATLEEHGTSYKFELTGDDNDE